VGETPNRNRSIITKEVATKIANSLPGSPIVGFYDENKQDFDEHTRELAIENGKLLLKDKTKPYGFVDLNAREWF
jgi:urate oxidase